jgi:hypothetical protein
MFTVIEVLVEPCNTNKQSPRSAWAKFTLVLQF